MKNGLRKDLSFSFDLKSKCPEQVTICLHIENTRLCYILEVLAVDRRFFSPLCYMKAIIA